MKHLLFLFLIFPLTAIAQTPKFGRVVDSKSSAPIEGVLVQYGTNQDDYVLSDSKGQFKLPEKNVTLLHLQCMGYKGLSVLYSVLRNNSTIRMELAPVELGEVEITAVDADKLLKKAFGNTLKKLLTHKNINYSLHFVQSKFFDSNEHTINLDYSTLLEKTKLSNGQIPYKLYLNQLHHINAQGQDAAGVQSFVNVGYHVLDILNYRSLSKYKSMISSAKSDSLIVLRAKLSKGNRGSATGIFHINKTDTTICFIDYAYETLIGGELKFRKNKDVKWAKKKHHVQVEFQPYNGMIFMSKNIFTIVTYCILEDGREDDITYYVNSVYTGIEDKKVKDKRKKLNAYSSELFTIPNTKDTTLR